MKFTTNGVMKFALAALLAVCLLGFAGETPAAENPPVSSEIVKYETFKGSDGVWRVRISLEVINRANDDTEIISVYDVSMNLSAYLADRRYGDTETPFTCKGFWKNLIPRRVELKPADSAIFKLSLPLTYFKMSMWKWEGEE